MLSDQGRDSLLLGRELLLQNKERYNQADYKNCIIALMVEARGIAITNCITDTEVADRLGLTKQELTILFQRMWWPEQFQAAQRRCCDCYKIGEDTVTNREAYVQAALDRIDHMLKTGN